MKLKLNAKKLTLNKETIHNLEDEPMARVKAGACTFFESGCVQTIICCTQNGPQHSCDVI